MNTTRTAPVVLKNPLIKDEVTILVSAEETKGEYGLLEVKVYPGGGNALHYHLNFSEHFEVLSGVLSVQAGKAIHRLQPGNSYTVEPRIAHRFFNEMPEPVIFMCTITPACDFEKAIRIGYGLANDGKVTKSGLPKNFWHTIILLDYSGTYLHGLPLWFQVVAVRCLVRFAKLFKADKAVMKYLEVY